MDIAVIGAGIAGLTAARTLQGAGHRVAVLEKSRGLGGRIATRRSAAGSFDHGAQYATARDTRFQAYLDSAAEAGAAAPWPVLGDGRVRHVGLPGMSGLIAPLAKDLDIRRGARVSGIEVGAALTLILEDGSSLRADRLVCAIPAPQATTLLGALDMAFDALGLVVVAPCWTLMAGFAAAPDLPDAMRDVDAALSWDRAGHREAGPRTRSRTRPRTRPRTWP